MEIDFMQGLKNKSMLGQIYVDSIIRSVFHTKCKCKAKSTKTFPSFFFGPVKPVVLNHIFYWWNLNVVLERIYRGNALLTSITQVVRNSNNKQISYIMTSTLNNQRGKILSKSWAVLIPKGGICDICLHCS